MDGAEVILQELTGAIGAALRYKSGDSLVLVVSQNDCSGTSQEIFSGEFHDVGVAEVTRDAGHVVRNKHTGQVTAVVGAGRAGASRPGEAEFGAFLIHGVD